MNKQMGLKISKLKLKARKQSPELFMYMGIAGVITASVLACRATLKLNDTLKKRNNSIQAIHANVDDENVEYTKEDAKKDITMVYTTAALDVAKLYAPAVGLGGVSIAAIIQSHNILNRRNAALAAAFTTVTESFNRYRKNVIDKYGEEIDRELKYGIKKEKVSVTDENGKTKKETIDVVDPTNGCSDYARFYDENCKGWTDDAEYNLMFLKSQQQYANDKLVAQGYLFLNDVYKMLGIPDSKAGQVVGWVYNPDNPEGDNFVDFGIYDVNVKGYRNDDVNDTISEERRDFVNGYRKTVLLDFNVDGNIWEKM